VLLNRRHHVIAVVVQARGATEKVTKSKIARVLSMSKRIEESRRMAIFNKATT